MKPTRITRQRTRIRIAAAVAFTAALAPLVEGRPSYSVHRGPRCSGPAATVDEKSDLVMMADGAGVAVYGTAQRIDDAVIRRALEQLRVSGKIACTAHRVRTGSGDADPTVPGMLEFLGKLRGGDTIRVVWGGGGITVSGWLHDDSRRGLLAAARPARSTRGRSGDTIPFRPRSG